MSCPSPASETDPIRVPVAVEPRLPEEVPPVRPTLPQPPIPPVIRFHFSCPPSVSLTERECEEYRDVLLTPTRGALARSYVADQLLADRLDLVLTAGARDCMERHAPTLEKNILRHYASCFNEAAFAFLRQVSFIVDNNLGQKTYYTPRWFNPANAKVVRVKPQFTSKHLAKVLKSISELEMEADPYGIQEIAQELGQRLGLVSTGRRS